MHSTLKILNFDILNLFSFGYLNIVLTLFKEIFFMLASSVNKTKNDIHIFFFHLKHFIFVAYKIYSGVPKYTLLWLYAAEGSGDLESTI